ncbi:MAG: 2-hydroxyglutaryl-CoA dehydratase [Deltaproteobacteria bacterium]|nr:2-hydroxyglutaryl-CoA dehydratase [Deltaproteobacteria bacterium]
MTKVVIMDQTTLTPVIGPTGPEHRKLANRVMEEALAKAKLSFDEITYVVATGYGRINVPFADKQITEISCHARGVGHLLPDARTVIDIGGQDSKGIKLKAGRVVDFVMNDKCAAGTGRFLEVTAEGLGVSLEDMGRLSLEAKNRVEISNTCTVFAAQEVVARLSEGVALPDIIAGLHEAIATRIYGMVRRLKIEREVALTGGGAKNIGLVKALEAKLGFPALLPPEPLLTGAIGAALLGRDIVQEAAEKGETLVRSERRLTEASIFT